MAPSWLSVACNEQNIRTVDMHTSGEATRIVYQGFPNLHGTLLEQCAAAKASHDQIRERIILEPLGHVAMYGAIPRQVTELTSADRADIGVLFATNEGYSTMCGHASIALGRFLVDCDDPKIFPRRDSLHHDAFKAQTKVRLHAPCGVVVLTVPTIDDGRSSDPSRPVSFVSVPSFSAGIDLSVPILATSRRPELATDSVQVDIGYGGAFYALVEASDLGFPHFFTNIDTQLASLSAATKRLKSAIQNNGELNRLIEHPDYDDLSFLYSIIVDDANEASIDQRAGTELGLCFFGDQQIDRSPTGGAVAARAAIAYAKGTRQSGQSWGYDSVISRHMGKGKFLGTIERVADLSFKDGSTKTAVNVRVEGYAYYTGFQEFIREETRTQSFQDFCWID